MKNKQLIIGLVVAVVVVVGGYLILKGGNNNQQNNNAATNNTTTQPATKQSASNATQQPAANTDSGGTTEAFKITANDTSSSPESINVKQGDTVKLTFNVSSQGTYHGGLDFKSTDPTIDSGSIAEGSSKTISFTATKSFKFTPYWYESNVKKDYLVAVNVQ